MPRTFIEQFTRPGQMVEDVYQVIRKDLRTTKKGTFFISARLRDRTGELPAIMWDASEALFGAIPQDGFALVKGRVGEFNDALQIVIEAMRPAKPAEVHHEDFLPVGPNDPEKDFAKLRKVLDQVKRPALRALLDAMWEDADLVERLKRAPAAEKYHHAYLGGLLEHTLSVAETALVIADRYPKLDRDLLVLGALWHDLGKTRELSYDVALGYTDGGILVGHLVQGVSMFDEKLRAVRAKGIEFSEPLADVVRHLIVAHHGTQEFGSPKPPMTAEAFVLHHIDNMDAKIHAFFRDVAADADEDRRWTGFNKMFGGRLFKGIDEPADETAEDDGKLPLKGGL